LISFCINIVDFGIAVLVLSHTTAFVPLFFIFYFGIAVLLFTWTAF